MMDALPSGWQAVARLEELPDGGLADVAVGRQLVLLLRAGERVRAFQGLCPHQFARLSEGTLGEDGLGEDGLGGDGLGAGWLQCPRHLARFGLDDGVCGPGWALPPLRRFATRVEAGRVLLPDPLVALT